MQRGKYKYYHQDTNMHQSKLIVGGDSFTAGSELLNTDNVWAKILSDEHNFNYVSTAEPGTGNLKIVDNVMQYVTDDCAVVVMFTFLSRHDLLMSFDTQERNSPWYALTPHHANLSEKHWFDDAHVRRAKQFGIDKFAEQFYMLVGDTSEAYYTLSQVLQLQNFLKVKNIPYMFTSADNWFLHNYELQNQTVTKTLVNNIDWDKFFWFPHDHGECGFYKWATAEQFDKGPGEHPLDEAHIQAARLMKDKFNELVKINNTTN